MASAGTIGRRRFLLVALLLVTVAGRGGYVLYLADARPERTAEGDTASYVEPARALAELGRFTRSVTDPEPEFLRTPGYPAFVAGVFKLWPDSLRAVLLLQVLLSALTVLVVYGIGAVVWGQSVGLVAAALTVLDPLQTYASGTVLTESVSALTMVFVAASAWRLFEPDRPRAAWAALVGLAIATATMVRPVTYYLPLLFLALFAVRFVRRPGARRAVVAACAAFLVPLIVVIGGWQLRNRREVGSWRLSGIEAKNLYLFRAAGVLADRDGIAFADAQHRLRVEFGPRPKTVSQGEYYGAMYRRGVRLLADDPLRTAKVTVEGLGSEVFGVQVKTFKFFGWSNRPWPAEAVALVGLLLAYALAGYGVVIVVRRRRARLAHAAMLGIAVYVLVLSAGPEAFGGRGERFRAPIMPIVLLYSALGAVELWQRRAVAPTARTPAVRTRRRPWRPAGRAVSPR